MQFISMVLTIVLIVYLSGKIYNNKELSVLFCLSWFLIYTFYDIFNSGKVIEIVEIFGISLQSSDFIIIVFSLVLLIDLFKSRKFIMTSLLLLTFIIQIILVINLVRGVSACGFSSELIGDIRTFFSFFVPIVFFGKYGKIEYFKKYSKIISLVMNMIVVIVVLIWALDIIFDVNSLESQINATRSDGGSTMRFITPYNVLGITFYTLALIRKDLSMIGKISLKTSIYSLVVILFQHRTIWLAFLLGVIVIIANELKIKKLNKSFIAQILSIIIVSILILLLGKGEFIENVKGSVETLVNIINGNDLSNTTINTRLLVWESTMNDMNGIDWIFGKAFGSGYAMSMGWETSPHSGYIRLLSRTGLVGILIFIILIFTIMKKQRYNNGYLYFVLCLIGFMYSYDFTWICGIILGLCISNKGGCSEKYETCF